MHTFNIYIYKYPDEFGHKHTFCDIITTIKVLNVSVTSKIFCEFLYVYTYIYVCDKNMRSIFNIFKIYNTIMLTIDHMLYSRSLDISYLAQLKIYAY